MIIETLEQRMEEDINGIERIPLITPRELNDLYPLTKKAKRTVDSTRSLIRAILNKKDKRKLVIVGPCSIHDIDEAKELARILKHFYDRVSDELVIIFRTYFQKPRTRIGWRGLIYDPDMDGSYDINKGLKLGGELLLYSNELGLPCATEFLDRSIARRIRDFISWGAIGARSSESQDHRDWVTGYPMPIGFKNPTSGDIDIAIDACYAAMNSTLSIDENDKGQTAYVITKGNPDVHLVLRGGKDGPNYDPDSIRYSLDSLEKARIRKNIIIDLSHGNSRKIYQNQLLVLDSVEKQILEGNEDIIGIMMETNLEEGVYDPKLGGEQRGKSRTDACLGIEESLARLEKLYHNLKKRHGR